VNGFWRYATELAVSDLAMLDVSMPELTGIEITRLLRADQIHTPVILLTACARRRHLGRCRGRGAGPPADRNADGRVCAPDRRQAAL
jgi:CheY-like chemotaxis protein